MTIDGLDIPIQSLTVSEMEEYWKANTDAKLFQLAIVNNDGQRAYDDSYLEQLKILDSAIAVPLRLAIQKHCKMDIDLEELEKN